MSRVALIFTRSLGAACAMLALAPAALAQSWEDNQQDEYPAQSAADDDAYPDDADSVNTDAGAPNSGDLNQSDPDQDGEQRVYDRGDADEGRSERRYGGWDRGYALTGSGVGDLYPALRDTPQGHMFVLRRFDVNRDRRISRGEARDANRAFFLFADRDRDGRLTDREVRFALSERQWPRGWRAQNQEPRWNGGPRYEDR